MYPHSRSKLLALCTLLATHSASFAQSSTVPTASDLDLLSVAHAKARHVMSEAFSIERIVIRERDAEKIPTQRASTRSDHVIASFTLQRNPAARTGSATLRVVGEERPLKDGNLGKRQLAFYKGFLPNPEVVLRGFQHTAPTSIDRTDTLVTFMTEVPGGSPGQQGMVYVVIERGPARIASYRLTRNGRIWMKVHFQYVSDTSSTPSRVSVVQYDPRLTEPLSFVSFWHSKPN